MQETATASTSDNIISDEFNDFDFVKCFDQMVQKDCNDSERSGTTFVHLFQLHSIQPYIPTFVS